MTRSRFMLSLLFGASVAIVLCVCLAAAGKTKSDIFIEAQQKVIDEHAKVLQDAGRMPADFASAYIVLGSYGWHGDGSSGSFGAYSFYEPAFEQATRSWWINGVMHAGSDLLIAVNRNVEFIRKCRGVWADSAGHSGQDCDPPMHSPVGYKVGVMYDGSKGAKVIEVVNGHTLRLDKKSLGEALKFDLEILPPDYVDMCACTTGTRWTTQ